LAVIRPLVLLAVVSAVLAGCSAPELEPGEQAVRRSETAERSTFFRVRESNSIIESGRPISTISVRIHQDPSHWRSEILYGDGLDITQGSMFKGQKERMCWAYSPKAGILEMWEAPDSRMSNTDRLRLIQRNYSFVNVGYDHVAGRPALRVEIRPRHSGRPFQRIWIDADTGLRLRREEWNTEGRLMAATEAVTPPESLTEPPSESTFIPSIPAGTRILARSRVKATARENPLADLGFLPAHVGYIPAGFQPSGFSIHSSDPVIGPFVRWELTDGLAGITILQTRGDLGALRRSIAPNDIRGPLIIWRQPPYHFIVRGNISREELRRVAKGMQPRENQPAP
jgi:hypothetical protein